MFDERHERRRIRELAEARERGDPQARAMWLLPRDARRTRESPLLPSLLSRRPGYYPEQVKVRAGKKDTWYDFRWANPHFYTRRCRVHPGGFPPAFDNQFAELSPVYVPLPSSVSPPPSGLTEEPAPGAQSGEGNWSPAPPVVGDPEDIERWRDAAIRYLSELVEVREDLLSFWRLRGRTLPLASWRRRRTFEAWQAHLTQCYARVRAASDAYRPVLTEVPEALAATEQAYQEMAKKFRKLDRWQRRRVWCLVPSGPDSFRIVRSDVAGDEATGGAAKKTLWLAFQQAKRERAERRAIEWDEESIRAADAELAAAAGPPQVGHTRSGQPMATFSVTSFESWFASRAYPDRDYRELSDPDRLARDRELHAQAVERRRQRASSRPAGSWPTAWEAGLGGESGGSHSGAGSDGGGGGGGGGGI